MVGRLHVRKNKRFATSVMLEPLENGHGYWVPEGICAFPSYTTVERGRGWMAVANVGKVDVKLRPQRKIATVSYGCEVTKKKVASLLTEQVPVQSAEMLAKFRQHLGVHVN